MLAKLFAVKVDEAAAMPRLFLAHAFEDSGRAGIVLAQALSKISVNALVFFFQRNGKSEDFPLRQLVEVLHGAIRLPIGEGWFQAWVIKA